MAVANRHELCLVTLTGNAMKPRGMDCVAAEIHRIFLSCAWIDFAHGCMSILFLLRRFLHRKFASICVKGSKFRSNFLFVTRIFGEREIAFKCNRFLKKDGNFVAH